MQLHKLVLSDILLKYVNISIIRLIDSVGDYLFLKNQIM